MQYFSSSKRFYRFFVQGLFFVLASFVVFAQDIPQKPIEATLPPSPAETVSQPMNSIGWGLGYIITDAGQRIGSFLPLGLQYSTSYSRKFSPLFSLEGSAHLQSTSFVLENVSNDNPDSVFYGDFTKYLGHSLTGTMSGVFAPFQDQSALVPLSFGMGLSLRWSGFILSNINTAHQSYRIGTSVFAQSIALGGHLSVSYTIPLSPSTEFLLRAFTDIYLPRQYITDERVPNQYQTALSILPTRLFPQSDTFYRYGGTIGLSAFFRFNF